MVERTYTSAEIQAGMSSALRAGDMKAVVGLLHLLATVDPASAQMLVGSIEYLNSQEPTPDPFPREPSPRQCHPAVPPTTDKEKP